MEGVTLLFEKEINIDLPLSGFRLIPGYENKIGLPIEMYLNLYAVKKEEKKLISSASELSKLITKISNKNEVWRFLHLFTSLTSHFLFQKEIYIIDLGVSSDSDQLKDVIDITPEVAQRIGFKVPEIRREENEYICSRDLASANPSDISSPVDVLRRYEAVSDDGIYRFIRDQIIGTVGRIDIPVPAYE